ncbi:MAG: HAD-IIIA family hydrolase [Aquificae bacterium]|nr:HAD-IIIA family hydrolase [Aquificota bacterium]
MKALSEKAKNIKLFAMDVDGVLTDGKIFYSSEGEEIKAFNVKDGLGIKLLKNVGIKTALISGRKSLAVEKRGKELDIDFLFLGEKNKIKVLEKLSFELSVKNENILYIGDDLIDLQILKSVGFPVCVPSSPNILKKECIYITKRDGGNGAVREVIDLLLELRGEYLKAIEEYL